MQMKATMNMGRYQLAPKGIPAAMQHMVKMPTHKPRERYVQAVRTSATANIAFGEVHAILYGQGQLPAAAASTTAASADTVSPAEV